MLTYVVMILNHHRLCHLQHHPHLPLNLIELCRSTQQIGAFQVRVRQTLTQVLFSSLQRLSFWQHWANWSLQVLEQWVERPPAICQTPGLLPLQDITQGGWSWREGVVIQAMALEAAHQLVESLPPEALEMEALEQLLGLQDALVEDSSTIDPRGFERISLGLPLLSEAAGGVTMQLTTLDPTLGRLPTVSVQVCPQSAIAVSSVQILGQWVWEVTRQFGVEVSFVGLSLIEQMAGRTEFWRQGVEIQGTQMLSGLGEAVQAVKLQTLARRVELLCQSRLIWAERQLSRQQIQRWQGWLWALEGVESSQGLAIAEGLRYEAGTVAEVTLQLMPGRWCERLIGLYGEEEIQAIRGMGRLARKMLAIDPVTQGMAAQAAVFLGFRAWTGRSLALTVGELLAAVEPEDRIRAIAHSSMRRDGFLQGWQRMWQLFQGMGWVDCADPLLGSKMMGGEEMGWLDGQLLFKMPAAGRTEEEGCSERGLAMPQRRGTVRGTISSRSLERALAIRGMSQATLARSLKLDRSTINRWINGSRPINPRYRPMLWELLGTDLQEG